MMTFWGEVVHRALDALTVAELVQMDGHQLRLQSGGLVVVELAALLVGHFIVTAVVVVVAEHGDVTPKPGDEVLHQGGLSAAGAAGNADDQNVVLHGLILPYSGRFRSI